MNLQDRVATARQVLAEKSPFVASYLDRLPVEYSDVFSHAGSDGTKLFINEEFSRTITDSQFLTVLLSIIHMQIFDIQQRCGDRQPRLWMMAANYSVHAHMVAEGLTTVEDLQEIGSLYDPTVDPKNDTTETIYDRLLKRFDLGDPVITTD